MNRDKKTIIQQEELKWSKSHQITPEIIPQHEISHKFLHGLDYALWESCGLSKLSTVLSVQIFGVSDTVSPVV